MSSGVETGGLAQLAPSVRRVTAPNAGMMTGPGTNTYIIGKNDVAVVDPGPRIDVHIEKILNDAPGPIRWILTTHTHRDHSPAAALLAQRTGAELIGMHAPEGPHQDPTFSPDRVAVDGDVLQTPEFRLQMIHTPGHASNHVCYLQEQPRWLYTGDHIMNGSTVVIDPPDGNMADYIRSLEKLKHYPIDAIAPGHGDLLDAPLAAVDWLIAHRLEREAKVINALAEHPECTSGELVPFAYREIDEKLYGWAERSLLAHLVKLEEEGRATRRDGRWVLVSPVL